jgi:hypothetical protein
MGGVNGNRVILPVVAVDAGMSRTLGVYGSSWLARSGLLITCAHCLPDLPAGQMLAVTRKNSRGGYDAHLLRDVEPDPRGFDLATARVDLEAEDQAWPMYPGNVQQGMPVWTFGYPLPDFRIETDGSKTFQIYPRFLRGYVTRRFLGDPPTHPKAELEMPCPPGISGAPLAYGQTDQVLGIIYGRMTVKVPDEDPAPLYHFGLAYDREILTGLRGAATDGRPVGDLIEDAPA